MKSADWNLGFYKFNHRCIRKLLLIIIFDSLIHIYYIVHHPKINIHINFADAFRSQLTNRTLANFRTVEFSYLTLDKNYYSMAFYIPTLKCDSNLVSFIYHKILYILTFMFLMSKTNCNRCCAFKISRTSPVESSAGSCKLHALAPDAARRPHRASHIITV